MTLLEDLLDSLLLIIQSNEVWSIAGLSFFVSFTAVLLSSTIGIPIGVVIGLRRGKSRLLPASLLHTGMALPPVLVGLLVFLMMTRRGPLGDLRLLFTPLAMIFAQMILTLPIVIGITRSTIKDLPDDLPEMLTSMGANNWQRNWFILCEARTGILIGIIVALGRAFSEVGAIIIVGGNIKGHTQVLTTAIMTEISKGDRSMALALGILLMTISFTLTTIMTTVQIRSHQHKV